MSPESTLLEAETRKDIDQKLIAAIVDAMIRLDKALKPFLRNI